ncbi:MAG: carbamoyltransferase HypF [Pontibacterium sp.]
MSGKPEAEGYRVTVQGLVQGVGFRPFVWHLARQLGLSGCVFNDASGVQVEVRADKAQLADFIRALQKDLPPLARIDHISSCATRLPDYKCFDIVASEQGVVSTGCAPDAATCQRCREELFDPSNRRFHYPFINCTHCGPRLSIIQRIPYDRAATTMADFYQCPACLQEYTDPANRRFHAQPNACAACGPHLWLENNSTAYTVAGVADLFDQLRQALKQGAIIAIKGLGGFHLACDATHSGAVNRLRLRKRRPDKAFALMVRDLNDLSRYAFLNDQAEQLLKSSAAPVVLLEAKNDPLYPLAEHIAPGQYQLGFMLPYTPLHLLLMAGLEQPLVMTSGNLSGMPQAITNEEARQQLSGIADSFVMHNRDIQNRVDDSVVRMWRHGCQVLRRARGYAPTSLTLPPGFGQAPDLVALGGELKNTLCLLQAGQAILSQHLGDLEDAHTFETYQQTFDLYQQLYQHQSRRLVCDLHPEYLSAKWGEQLSEQGYQLLKVQHHHAHMAACLGDNQYALADPPVLALCFDGSGYGPDGTLWGGEFLWGDYRHYKRLASLKTFPLIGGAQAIKEPWRCLFAQLKQALPDVSQDQLQACWPVLAGKPCMTLERMMAKGLNSPLTSSCGRLFDAVAAALGCSAEVVSYEGQAAIELETLARDGDPDTQAYLLTLDKDRLQIDPAPLWVGIMQDLQAGQRSLADMALAFHKGLVQVVIKLCVHLKTLYPIQTVALTGGVMQNMLLLDYLKEGLAQQEFSVLTHQQLPANDGALAYGQALIAAARQLEQGDDQEVADA